MIASILHRLRQDRKGATALIAALALVPMIIVCGAAVDFSRVSAARAQLQMAADSAALAGVGTYQNMGSQDLASGSQAAGVAGSAFSSSTAILTNYITITNKTFTAGCNGTATPDQCGTGNTTACVASQFYCVTVTATATMTNSLLAPFIPSEALSVTAQAATAETIGANQFHSTNVANAYDENAIYAYAVPQDANGNPLYNKLPYPNTNCSGPITNGILAQEIANGSTSSGTGCSYYEIGDSNAQSGLPPQSQIQLGYNQLVAFLFVNVTGNTHRYGFVPVGTGSAVLGTGTGAGFCPDWTLYGSISQEPNNITPPQDSTDIYSSAYEKFGMPPTYSSNPTDESLAADPNGINQPFGTNHRIVPFTVPAGTDVGNQNIKTSFGTTTFYVNNNKNANPANNVSLSNQNGYTLTTVSENPSNILYYYNSTTNQYATTQFNSNYVAVYGSGLTNTTNEDFTTTVAFQCPNQSSWTATYFPSNQYYEATSGFYGPAVVSGCTPTNPPTSPGNWNFSGSNLGNCANAGTSNNEQTSNYNNCALLIQDLGQNISSLPNSFTTGTQTASFTDPNTGQVTSFTQNILIPSTTTSGNQYWPPASTAHKCYDPGAGYDTNTGKFADTLATAENYDAIENPNDGAVLCNSSTPESYGLYWNDMGSNESDDLGYWNAITLFTCSTPANSGGAATLSE